MLEDLSMRKIIPFVVSLFVCLAGSAGAFAQSYSLVDTAVISKKFENSMAIAKQLLAAFRHRDI
jgi:hypothetical protein